MVLILSPILVNVGYKIDWKGMLVVVWCGVRGTVGLALALVVEQTRELYETNIGSKVCVCVCRYVGLYVFVYVCRYVCLFVTK